MPLRIRHIKIILFITNEHSTDHSDSVIKSWSKETEYVRPFTIHELKFRKDNFPIAEDFSKTILSLPIGLH